MRLLIAAFAVLALAAPADAAEIVVTTTNDSFDAAGDTCSLREATSAVNDNNDVLDCTAGDPTAPDTIVLAPTTYMLSQAGVNDDFTAFGDLDIYAGGPVTIEGNGATIDAAGLDRVLDVLPNASLTLRNVTLTGGAAPSGQPGGGILNRGTLTLEGVTVTGNRIAAAGAGFEGGSGGGIFSTDTLSLTGTTVSDNLAGDGGSGAAGGRGGGIFVTGTATLARSSLLRNRAGNGGDGNADEDGGAGGPGGGLYVSPGGPGTTVTNSLFAANAAGHGGDGGDGSGGGPSGDGGNGGNGGALATGVSTAGVAFSTFLDNTAGAGGVAGSGGPPGTQGATGEGSAVTGGAQTSLARTIAVGTCLGALVDGGQNLGSGGCPGASAATGLGADGSPRAGSPAIDAGPATGCPATDLLGTARPQGLRCDIGAIEARAATLSFSRSAFAFPALTAGLRTATLGVTVRNPGLAGAALPISVTGTGFRLASETCPAALTGGRSCAVTVAFAPTRAGRLAGNLRIAGFSFALTGTGLAPCVVPKLKRMTLKRARRALRRGHCTLGTVTRRGRGRRGRIRASQPKTGAVLAAGAAVNVVVNRRRARHRR